MDTQSSKPLRHEQKRPQTADPLAHRHVEHTPPNAWLDSGVPALIGGLAAAAAGGLSIVPAVGIAAAAGLGYTMLRIRNRQD